MAETLKRVWNGSVIQSGIFVNMPPKQKSRGCPGISYSTDLMRYAKFFATNSQFTRLLRKVSTNLGRRLR